MVRPLNPQQPPADGDATVNIFGYVPSLALAVASVVLFSTFALSNAVQVAWGYRRRTSDPVVSILLLVGCLFEVIGYGWRIRAHYKPFAVIPFVLQYFFIVVAPVFLTAALYITLTNLLARLHIPTLSVFGLRWTRKRILQTFVVADVLTTVLQIVGAALVGVGYSRDTAPLTPDQAGRILLSGLCVQLFFTLVFFILLLVSARACARQLDSGASAFFVVLASVALATLLLILRISVRLAEAADGPASDISTSENIFLTECIPVILAVFLLTYVTSLADAYARRKNHSLEKE